MAVVIETVAGWVRASWWRVTWVFTFPFVFALYAIDGEWQTAFWIFAASFWWVQAEVWEERARRRR